MGERGGNENIFLSFFFYSVLFLNKLIYFIFVVVVVVAATFSLCPTDNNIAQEKNILWANPSTCKGFAKRCGRRIRLITTYTKSLRQFEEKNNCNRVKIVAF